MNIGTSIHRISAALALSLVLLVPSAPRAQDAPDARIVFEVGSGGLSSGSTNLRVPSVLLQQTMPDDSEVTIGQVGYGALHAHGRYLLPGDGGGLSAALSFIASPPFEIVQTEAVDALVDDFSVNLVWPGSLDSDEYADVGTRILDGLGPENVLVQLRLPDLVTESWWVSSARNAAGEQAYLVEPAIGDRPVPVSTASAEWEVRFRLGTDFSWDDELAATLLSIEKRVGEGTRRAVWEAQQIGEVGSANSLLVLGGDCIEGRSWIENQPFNLHRSTTWTALETFHSPLMVPALAELAASPAQLTEEAAAAGVTLISANLFDPATGEPLFQTYERRELGGVDVAIVGLTPPSVQARLTPEVASQLVIADPATSLLAVVAELVSSELGPPDLTVLATSFSRQDLAEITTTIPGIDIVLGLREDNSIRNLDTAVTFDSTEPPGVVDIADRWPVLNAETSWGQVGTIDVVLQDGLIAGLRRRVRVVEQTWTPDPELLSTVNQVRHDLYAAQERLLFPNLETTVRSNPSVQSVFVRGMHSSIAQGGLTEEYVVERYAMALSWSLWQNYVANTVREYTDTDVALLRQTAQPISLAGAIQELFIHAFLKDHDEIWIYTVTGEVLAQLLGARGTAQQSPDSGDATFPPPIASGTIWSAGLVGGRAIDPSARYRVAMSSYLVSQPDYAVLLGTTEPTTHFVFDGDGLDGDEEGERAMLHGLIVADLETRLAAHPDLGAAYLAELTPQLVDQGAERMPLFVFRISDLAFSFSQTSRQLSATGFDAVRNTRVNQVDSLTLTTGGTLSAVFDTSPLVTTLVTTAKYGELRVDEDITETADDLQGALDLQLRALSFGSADAVMPYATSRYDTEITPAENDDGSEQPRQSELRNSLGLLGKFSDVFTEFRAGLFHQSDFAAEEGSQSFGAELVLKQKASLGPVSQTFSLDASYFLPSDDDTAEDLSFTIQSSLSFAVPIVGSLSFETFVDTLWFRGQLASNDEVGLSLIVGAGLRIDEVFRARLD